jgi:hypothetical protein
MPLTSEAREPEFEVRETEIASAQRDEIKNAAAVFDGHDSLADFWKSTSYGAVPVSKVYALYSLT